MNTCAPTIARMVKIVAPIAVIGALFATMATPSMAQDINRRLHDQDVRVRQGVRAHDLSKYEAHALYARDRGIRHAEVFDRRHDHGHLTGVERTRLDQRLNRESRVIYDRKHDVR